MEASYLRWHCEAHERKQAQTNDGYPAGGIRSNKECHAPGHRRLRGTSISGDCHMGVPSCGEHPQVADRDHREEYQVQHCKVEQ